MYFIVPGALEPRRVEPTEEEARGVDGRFRLGQCVPMAVAYEHAHPKEAVVVYGEIVLGRPGRGDVIGHAWVEIGGKIYDGVMGRFYDAADYRQQLSAKESVRWRPQERHVVGTEWLLLGI